MAKLVECVPNFSEGRDRAKIDAITEVITKVAGVRLLDVDPGADTNRTVVTFVGPPAAVAEAAFQAIRRAAEVIDMRLHHGAHARSDALRNSSPVSSARTGPASCSCNASTLLAELVPTPKIIAELRDWHPRARIVGWKFEVDGRQADALALGERQLTECRTDACVVNGLAYCPGFGLVTGRGHCAHLPDAPALFAALESFLHQP